MNLNSLTEKSLLFGDYNGRPLLFFIPYNDAQRTYYRDKLYEHGGIITETRPSVTNSIILASSNPVLDEEVPSYRLQFIDDCIAAGMILNISNYQHYAAPPATSASSITHQLNTPKTPATPSLGLSGTNNTFALLPNQYIVSQYSQLQAQQRRPSQERPSSLPQAMATQHPTTYVDSTPKSGTLPQMNQTAFQPQPPAPQFLQSNTIHGRQQNDYCSYGLQPGQFNASSSSSSRQLLGLQANELSPSSTTPILTGPTSLTKFTPEKDEFILERVREKPRERNSHKFFRLLAEYPILKEHTANSLRNRFRHQLFARLKYIYKSDERGELIRDPQTNEPVRVGLDQLPLALKNKYTAEDDMILCQEILDYNKQKNIEISNDITVPVSYFKKLHSKYPHHPTSSWRDRYRKFVQVVGCVSYMEYYSRCLALGQVPKPIDKQMMKDFNGYNYKTKHSLNDAMKKKPNLGTIVSVGNEDVNGMPIFSLHSSESGEGDTNYQHNRGNNHFENMGQPSIDNCGNLSAVEELDSRQSNSQSNNKYGFEEILDLRQNGNLEDLF
ncbi:DNA-binding transcription factor rap1 [Scheffersomyces spartinae]|uniref:DNA-binding protein RAP1 n=1 Tax=Scheffersomyces spartinae TaxID=45513 RepID=A0A9P7VBK9_9ASCO|nr:DNA-binding transcription factor rap1 [Scheffersomyces spartinae]KAG7194793.1 DNA-binding transcription factor rap1 [Scheffersomyces spartinae]